MIFSYKTDMHIKKIDKKSKVPKNSSEISQKMTYLRKKSTQATNMPNTENKFLLKNEKSIYTKKWKIWCTLVLLAVFLMVIGSIRNFRKITV